MITKDDLRFTINQQKREISRLRRILSELTRTRGIVFDSTSETMTFLIDSENTASELAERISRLGYNVVLEEIQGGFHRFQLKIKF